MGLTGLQWSFPAYRTGLYNLLGVDRSRNNQEEVNPAIDYSGLTPISLDASIAKANEILAYDGNYNISLPKPEASSIAISKSKVGFFAPSGSDRITLNKYTAEVEKKDIFLKDHSTNALEVQLKRFTWATYLALSRRSYFITCLIATSLPVTGTIIWVNKLKKKRLRRRKSRLDNV